MLFYSSLKNALFIAVREKEAECSVDVTKHVNLS